MAQSLQEPEKQGPKDVPFSDLPEWKLEDLYPAPDSPELNADIQWCLDSAAKFETDHAGKLAQALNKNPRDLALIIAAYEEIEERMGKVMSYAGLLYATNSIDPVHAKLYGDAQEKLTNAGSSLLFFTLELNQLNGSALEKGYEQDASLAYYRPWLTELRKEKPYQLDEKLELLFHEKSITGRAAWNRLFDDTMASLEFEIGGEKLSVEPALNLLQDGDRSKREAAAKEISRVLNDNISTFTLITNTLAKDHEIANRWRGFEDVADPRHLANSVEREVVEALVNSVQSAFPTLSHRYYKMKARWLGLDVMEQWDRNAPLPFEDERVIEWAQAKDTVLDAYGGFAPEMADIAKRFFDGNWIDAPVRKGKSPGAFAHPTVPSAHPYVLVNYLGKPRDVMTLAHELGHGVHQVLAGGQGVLMAQTPLTLAETASVFGEMLTFRSLLDKTDSVASRKALLAQKVEDMLNTVVRQIAFYMFERKVHLARLEGELTAEQIGTFWFEVQKESLGPAFRFDESYSPYWAYISHFIRAPFYVYAYAFGDCLVNSLYAVYENAEPDFQQKYFDLLRAGGSKHHSELLKPFGLNAADSDFWDQGLAVISAMIDELEGLDSQA